MQEEIFVYSPIVEDVYMIKNELCTIDEIYGHTFAYGVYKKSFIHELSISHESKRVGKLIQPRWSRQVLIYKHIEYVKKLRSNNAKTNDL